MPYISHESLPYLVEKLTDPNNIKITGNPHGTRVSTVVNKLVEKTDAITGAVETRIENRENYFKVGTGLDGTNVQDSVEEGFSVINIQGKTIQNYFDSKKVGTLRALSDNKNGSFTSTGLSWDYGINLRDYNLIKPKTFYTLILEVSNWTYSGKLQFRKVLATELLPIVPDIMDIKGAGVYRVLCKSAEVPNFASDIIAFKGQNPEEVDGAFTIRPMIVEGDHTNTPLSELLYINEIQGVGNSKEGVNSIGVCSNGKNLLDITKQGGHYSYNTLSYVNNGFVVSGDWYCSIQLPKMNYDKSYYFSFQAEQIEGTSGGIVKIYDKTEKKEIGSGGAPGFKFTPTSSCNLNNNIELFFYSGTGSDKKGKWKFTNIQMEEGLTPTPYEPYKEDALEYLINGEQLHSLPNGVCDEILNGALIRRIGKFTLNGNETWGGMIRSTIDSNLITGYWRFDSMPKISDYNYPKIMFSNDFAIISGGNDYESSYRSVEGLSGYTGGAEGGNWIYLTIDSRKLTSASSSGVQEWLRANPMTFYYQLAYPTVTNIPQNTCRIFKNGHISFNTLITPISTHTVLLNKSAQIEASIREIQSLGSRINNLESFYDNMMIETSHKLNLLDLDFDYIRESEEI